MKHDEIMEWVSAPCMNPKKEGKGREGICYPYRIGRDLIGLSDCTMHAVRGLESIDHAYRLGTTEDWGSFPNYERLFNGVDQYMGLIESTPELRSVLKQASKIVEFGRLVKEDGITILRGRSRTGLEVSIRIQIDGELTRSMERAIHIGRFLSAISYGGKQARTQWRLLTDKDGGKLYLAQGLCHALIGTVKDY